MSAGFHTESVETLDSELDAEGRRFREQALVSWDKEARNLAWFGLRDGMSLLEIGSGPGFITERLLAMLPGSRLTCVEIDAEMVRRAERYLAARGGSRVRFVTASITDTGLPAESFDFAYARLVFQYLPDPVRAAREVRRLLRPGGRLVVTDVEDGLWGILDPDVVGWRAMVESYARARAAKGADRRIGRKLLRILREAGFDRLQVEAIALHSLEQGIEAFLWQIAPDRLAPLAKEGLISRAELEAARSAYERFVADAEPSVLRLLLMACGEKPERAA